MTENLLSKPIEDFTREELSNLVQFLMSESLKREAIETAPERLKSLQMETLAAQNVQFGQEWRQPLGAHNAYPKDWVLIHNGDEWESLIESNVYEPGVSGWRKKAAPGEYSPWIQPTGAHDAYSFDDIVTHKGQNWISIVPGQNTNTWAPGVYGWKPYGA